MGSHCLCSQASRPTRVMAGDPQRGALGVLRLLPARAPEPGTTQHAVTRAHACGRHDNVAATARRERGAWSRARRRPPGPGTPTQLRPPLRSLFLLGTGPRPSVAIRNRVSFVARNPQRAWEPGLRGGTPITPSRLRGGGGEGG